MNPLPASRFTTAFTSLNWESAPDFSSWSFRSGMKFGDFSKWWDEGNQRPSPHEGLDLAAYLDSTENRHSLRPGIYIPPLFDGKVLNIIDDFLGKTIIVQHRYKSDQGLRLLSFTAHILPSHALSPGSKVSTREPLGEIAPGNNKCPPHLHISTAWVSPAFDVAGFSWAKFRKQEGFLPCDPMLLLNQE